MEGNNPPPLQIKIPPSNVFTFDQITIAKQSNNTNSTQNTKQTKVDQELAKKMRIFYDKQLEQVQQMPDEEVKEHDIPLARVKRIMKSDQDVKVSSFIWLIVVDD